jgi:ferredoxin-thioredoxin reductase catalytic subunit
MSDEQREKIERVWENGIDEKKMIKFFLQDFADAEGYELTEKADAIIDKLIARNKQYGRYFCPCRRVDEEKENDDIVCPCQYVHEDIAANGKCFCNLFKRKNIQGAFIDVCPPGDEDAGE